MARATLTKEESWWLVDAVNYFLGQRPSKAEARANSKAIAVRWAWGSVRGWTERKLRKYDRPATTVEIYEIVRQYVQGKGQA